MLSGPTSYLNRDGELRAWGGPGVPSHWHGAESEPVTECRPGTGQARRADWTVTAAPAALRLMIGTAELAPVPAILAMIRWVPAD